MFSFGKKLRDFSELVAFEHTIFSASFSFMAIFVALLERHLAGSLHWLFAIKIFVLCIIALVSARNFAMGFNRLCDRGIDSRNARTQNRPSVDGRIGVVSLVGFCVLNAVVFLGVSYFINSLAFFLSFPFLGILGFYSFMKRFSTLAHFVLGLCLGLAPIAGAVAILGSIPLWSVFLAIGVLFWVAGFDLLYSLQDMEFDKREGLFSFPAKFGIAKSLRFSRISHALAVLFWALFLWAISSDVFGMLGLACAACMLVYEQFIVARDLSNIPKAFFITNGYLGFVFLFFMILEVLARAFYA